MFLILSPRGTYLTDEGLQDDRFAVWSFDRRRAAIYTREEFDSMSTRWRFLGTCELVPALQPLAPAPHRPKYASLDQRKDAR